MASISLHTSRTVPSLLQSQTPKTSFPHNLLILSRSSQTPFHGLKLPNSSHLSIPSSASVKASIVAKVMEGMIPPTFTLKDQNGKPVSLSKFKGKPIVVYFYPADETPGCTKQRDSYEKYKEAGAEVVGISGDNTTSHKRSRFDSSPSHNIFHVTEEIYDGGISPYFSFVGRLQHEGAFAEKYRLPYTLLSDEGNKVRKEWGVTSDLFGALPGRVTYVLDKDGVCRLIYSNQFQSEKHIEQTLKFLKSVRK
ncbi:hypothetical protein OROHE_012343 [Orobanche hederae]